MRLRLPSKSRSKLIVFGILILLAESILKIQTQSFRIVSNTIPTVYDVETTFILNDAPFNFSACLLTMDDNKLLPEWLAYHFEVLPLRRLIIAIDPYSLSSPIKIIDAYRDLLDMHITLWEDKDYMYSGKNSWQRPVYHTNATAGERHKAYLWRQVVFYTQCALQLKREGLEWVVLIDSDEFMSYNFFPKAIEVINNKSYHSCRYVNVPGISACRSDGYPVDMMQYFGIDFPRRLVDPQSTIAHFIHNFWNDTVYEHRHGSRVCDVAARAIIGSYENNSILLPKLELPPTFIIDSFKTLRYRFHDHLLLAKKPGKAIMNLQQWNGKYRLEIHRGNSQCFNAKHRKTPEASLSFFRVHHYTGSLEEFTLKPSSQRRTIESFQMRNNFQISGHVNEVMGWLESFIRRVGPSRAHFLTQGLREWAYRSDVDYFSHQAAHDQSQIGKV